MSRRRTQELPGGLRPEDLPQWMRKTRREVDSLIPVLALIGALVIPLLIAPGWPVTVGTQQQIARTVEMSDALQAGILYPRWAPDFYYGYGSPLWNYRAPLPHWLTGLHRVLLQTSSQTSLKTIMGLTLALGGLGIFSFARRRWGVLSGTLATLGFLLNPQMIWDLPLVEGDLGAMIAVSAFAGALWGFERALASGRARDVGRAALLAALVWLAHTPLNIILAALLLGWIAWVGGLKIIPRAAVRRALAAWLLGALLSAVYLVPAWWERGLVRWHAATEWPSANWQPVAPAALLALPPRVDLSAVNPPGTEAIGVAIWALALAAILVALAWDWRHTPPVRVEQPISRGEAYQARLVAAMSTLPAAHAEMIYFALAALITGLAATRIAEPLWTRVPAWLEFYPRDLVAVCAALCALVIAQLGWVLDRTRRAVAALGLVGCASALVAGVFPLLVTPQWPSAPPTASALDLLRDEVRGYLSASLTDGWLLPRSITALPSPSPQVLSSYQLGYVDKIAREQLPAATQVDVIAHSPQAERLAVKARRPFTLVLHTLYFAGWKALLNEQALVVDAESSSGLLTLKVPEGVHDLYVKFGGSGARDAGLGLSAMALLLTGALLLRRDQAPSVQSPPGPASTIPVIALVPLLALVALGAAFPRALPDLVARRSPPGIVQPAAAQVPRAFQGGVDLLSVDVSGKARLAPGDDLTVHLYWRATRPDLPDYQAELRLVAAEEPGFALVSAAHRHPGGIPTSRWSLWPLLRRYVRDSYYLRIPDDAPGGEYYFVVRLGPCSSASIAPCPPVTPLFVTDGRGSSMGNQAIIPQMIRISGPADSR
ncbi:MAG: hypothetical protein OZ934_05630 [Anaerolineae bacterium]|nr:hypothetical protein [Anaerolineae bacterium]